jgi:hypothetical protein
VVDALTLTYNALLLMAIFRRSKNKKVKPRRGERRAGHIDLAATLQSCLEKIARLEQADDTHIKRMAEIQAEINTLRALIGQQKP